MAKKRFILAIYGPSCAGKTSVVEELLKKHEELFRISKDKIKWLISNYDNKKHSEIVYRLLLKLAKKAIDEKFSLIVEGGISPVQGKEFRFMAEKNKLNFFEINIEAPFEVIKERFKERVQNAKNQKTKMANKGLKRFKELYEIHKNNKKTMVTFDSSKLSTKKIVKEIETIIY